MQDSQTTEMSANNNSSVTLTIFSAEFWKDPKKFKLLGLGLGLIGFFIIYGILQERIMTIPYGDPPVMFKSSTYLVLNNRLVGVIIALGMLQWRGESFKASAPLYTYALISLSNVVATWCQYEALKYVSFPTQTLGKCGKMIPVMIMGAILSGKRYNLDDYLSAFTITAGCMIFLLTGKYAQGTPRPDTPLGLLLILGYLFSDGFTSTLQERLFKGYNMSTYQQMLYVSLVSSLFSLAGLIIRDELLSSIGFSLEYPSFFMQSLGLSLCAVFGVMVIYTTVKEFGALIFATIMTTRQLLNIVFSCIIYANPITLGQAVGIAMVFGTMYYKSAEKKEGRGGHGSHGSNNHGDKSVSVKVDPMKSLANEIKEPSKPKDENA